LLGYIENTSPVKVSRKDRKRKYFEFSLIQNDATKRAVCFSPEKHELISEIEKEQAGCELRKAKVSASNDIMITDFTSVRKTKINFPKESLKLDFSTIASINNEKSLYERVNVKGIVLEVSDNEQTEIDGKPIDLRKTVIGDNTGSITLTLFANLVNMLKPGHAYTMQNLRVSKYQSQRLLKTTDVSKINVLEEHDFVMPDHISSSSLTPQYLCFICKAKVDVDDSTFVECSSCNNVFVLEKALKSSTVKFTASTHDFSTLHLTCKVDLIERHYNCGINNRIELLKKMLSKKKIFITYDTVDMSVSNLR